MQLIPKLFVLGVFTPTGVAGTPDPITAEKINRVWVELAPRLGYTQLQLSTDGAAGNFLGPTPDDGVTIQPPLLQFRTSIRLTVDQAAEDAHSAMKVIARQIGATGFQQLGIKLVYWAAMADNDAAGFVLHRVFGRSEDDLAPLQGGGKLWTGAKFVVQHPSQDPSQPSVSYTTLVEPLLRDPRYLYLDVDAKFPGPADLDRIPAQVKEVHEFLSHTVAGFLDSLTPGR
jgi:hypothetical protein